MPFPLAAALTGGAVLGGSAINAALQTNTNDTQLKLSRTAHQREVKDLRAAGLNPILSAGGSGSDLPHLESPQVNVEGAMSSALSAAQAKASIAQAMAGAKNQLSQSSVADAQRRQMDDTRQAFVDAMLANIDATRVNTGKARLERDRLDALGTRDYWLYEAKKMRADAETSALGVSEKEAESKFYEDAGPTKLWLDMILKALK